MKESHKKNITVLEENQKKAVEERDETKRDSATSLNQQVQKLTSVKEEHAQHHLQPFVRYGGSSNLPSRCLPSCSLGIVRRFPFDGPGHSVCAIQP